jgi:nicotinamidase-related amidase
MKRALLVIDVQNEYVNGTLPIAFPPLAVSLPNIGAAIDAAHDAGIPVVAIQQTMPSTAPIFAHGSRTWEFAPVVAERRVDIVLEKTLPGSFAETNLAAWLRERGVDTVTVIGYMTQNCVDATTKQGFDNGFSMEVLADATGTLPYANAAGSVSAATLHESILVALNARFAAVATTQAWIDALRADAPLARSNILETVRQGADAAVREGEPQPA